MILNEDYFDDLEIKNEDIIEDDINDVEGPEHEGLALEKVTIYVLAHFNSYIFDWQLIVLYLYLIIHIFDFSYKLFVDFRTFL